MRTHDSGQVYKGNGITDDDRQASHRISFSVRESPEFRFDFASDFCDGAETWFLQQAASDVPFPRSEPCCFGEIHSKSVPSPLIPPRHLGGRMSQMFLNVAFIDFGGGSETCPQRVAGKFESPLDLTEIGSNASSHRRPFHQPRHFLVIEPIGSNSFALSRDAAEEGAMCKLCELDPGFHRGDRAGGIGRTTADLDFPPSGLGAQGDEHALVEDLDPAAAVFCLIGFGIETNDL